MKSFFHVLIYVLATISFIRCDYRQKEVRMTFSRDIILDGVKTEKIIRTGNVRNLSGVERDSIEQVLKNSVALTGNYLVRNMDEDTVVYLDRLIAHWLKDSLSGKIAKDELTKIVAIQFGQSLVDNNNFEWKRFESELIVNERSDVVTEFPDELVKEVIHNMDSMDLEKTKRRIIRDVKIMTQVEALGNK
jgi:hypothetical protein